MADETQADRVRQVEQAEVAGREVSLTEVLLEAHELFPQLESLPWWSWPVAAFVATYAVFIKGALDLTKPPGGDDDGSPFDGLDGFG